MSHSTSQHVVNTKNESTQTPSGGQESEANTTVKHGISDPRNKPKDPLDPSWGYPDEETMEYAPGLFTSPSRIGCGMHLLAPSWEMGAAPKANDRERYTVTGGGTCSGCSKLGCKVGERFGCNCEYGCGCGCGAGRRSMLGWTNTG